MKAFKKGDLAIINFTVGSPGRASIYGIVKIISLGKAYSAGIKLLTDFYIARNYPQNPQSGGEAEVHLGFLHHIGDVDAQRRLMNGIFAS